MATIVGREILHSGWTRLIRLQIDENGQRYSREVEDHGDSVAVLPYDPERACALLVRLLRAPMMGAGDGMSLEAPAGLIDKGEDEAAAVRREALEEAGVELGQLERVGRGWVAPGISTERASLFLAAYSLSTRVGKGGGVAAENENIQVVETPLERLAHMMDAGAVMDMRLMLLIAALRLRRPELFAGKD